MIEREGLMGKPCCLFHSARGVVVLDVVVGIKVIDDYSSGGGSVGKLIVFEIDSYM